MSVTFDAEVIRDSTGQIGLQLRERETQLYLICAQNEGNDLTGIVEAVDAIQALDLWLSKHQLTVEEAVDLGAGLFVIPNLTNTPKIREFFSDVVGGMLEA